ncbi:MAG: hypothetical protein ACI835_001888 [Planctomycetota bacterium]|jgi:hypothetical protein
MNLHPERLLAGALPALCLAGLSTSALAVEAELHAWSVSTHQGLELQMELRDATPGNFSVYARPTGIRNLEAMPERMLIKGTVDANGWGFASVILGDVSRLPAGLGISMRAVQTTAGLPAWTPPYQLPLSGIAPDCLTLDMDFAIGEEPELGQFVDDEWSPAGITVSAINNTSGHPDAAIIFDSANPTGDDPDLATPGTHPSNTVALGKLLIIAENTNGGGDGFVDNPDDERFGGVITFDFDNPITICSITVVDIDDGDLSWLEFHQQGGGINVIPLQNMGDNSVQTIGFTEDDVMRLEVHFGGSGGIGGLELSPCPLLVNLDEEPLGVPMDLQRGEQITNQFAFLDVTVSAVNNTPGHPNKVILFDTANPTGGDDDLATPGTGIGNNEALGMVMIIPEDDVDAGNDGYVDDPDDEGGGGTFSFDYANPVTFLSIRVLDVDSPGLNQVEFYDNANNLLTSWNIPNIGDNSVQILTGGGPVANCSRVDVVISGSGAVTRLRWCP